MTLALTGDIQISFGRSEEGGSLSLADVDITHPVAITSDQLNVHVQFAALAPIHENLSLTGKKLQQRGASLWMDAILGQSSLPHAELKSFGRFC